MATNGNIVLTALLGDALALGPHWIYSQRDIAEKIGQITGYHDPISAYHPGKSAGDFTHYGDQTMLLLRSLAERGRFDLEAFAAAWRSFWNETQTKSYRDSATASTLAHLAAGGSPEAPGSFSNDIAGAARIAPLFLLNWETENALLEAARAQTQLTHGRPEVIESAEFFARVILAVQAGQTIPEAIRSTADRDLWDALSGQWFAASEQSSQSEEIDRRAAKAHGLTCHTPDAFPVILHFLLRYPNEPEKALAANAEAGGDSAARGLFLGMIYGARFDAQTLPTGWLEGLNARPEIEQLIDRITSHG